MAPYPSYPPDLVTSDVLSGITAAMYLAMVFSVLLFGGLTVQVVMYLKSYHNDKTYQKIVIISVWALMATMTTLAIYSIYELVMDNYVVEAASPWNISVSVEAKIRTTCGGLVIPLIHSLHLHRIFTLYDRERHIPVLVSVMAIVNLGMMLAVIAQFAEIENFSHVPSQFTRILNGFLTTTAMTDISISSTLCYYLRKSKREMMTQPTQSVMSRLTKWMLWSGVSACVWSLSSLITALALPNTLYILLPLSWSAFYANSFLAMTLSHPRLQERSPKSMGTVSALQFACARTEGSVELRTIRSGHSLD